MAQDNTPYDDDEEEDDDEDCIIAVLIVHFGNKEQCTDYGNGDVTEIDSQMCCCKKSSLIPNCVKYYPVFIWVQLVIVMSIVLIIS